MTGEEDQLWDEVFARLPRPFRDNIGVCRNGVFLRRGRAVVICDGEPMAMIVLRGDRCGQGRAVAGADYGVMRDKDLLARAVTFLRFAD